MSVALNCYSVSPLAFKGEGGRSSWSLFLFFNPQQPEQYGVLPEGDPVLLFRVV